jgi:hypothetical protein
MHGAYARATLALCHARQGIDVELAADDALEARLSALALGADYVVGVAAVAEVEIALRARRLIDVDPARMHVAAAGDPTLDARLARLAGLYAVSLGQGGEADECFAQSVSIAESADARAELLFTVEAAALSGHPVDHPETPTAPESLRDALGVVNSPMRSLAEIALDTRSRIR